MSFETIAGVALCAALFSYFVYALARIEEL